MVSSWRLANHCLPSAVSHPLRPAAEHLCPTYDPYLETAPSRRIVNAGEAQVFSGNHMNQNGKQTVAATVTHLPGEPVIIITAAESGEAVSWRHLHERVAELMKQIDGAVYRITDFSGVDVSFDMLAVVLREETRARPGSASDPRVREVLVGSSEILKLAALSLSQPHYIGEEVPVFSSLAEALLYVRSQNGRRIGAVALAGAS